MIIDIQNYQNKFVGNKAKGLFFMAENGINVPKFFCTDEESSREKIEKYLSAHFKDTGLFSVRSSSSMEDGEKHSFAGQFNTYLNVKKQDVFSHISKIRDISCNDSIAEYCSVHGIKLDSVKISVIIQEMVEADLSGVIFTANPQGILNETVIVAGEGTGENVVEDKVDTTSYYYNNTDDIYYYEQKGLSPLLTEEQITCLIEISAKIKKLYHIDCDIEFAIKNNEISILQARPITTLPGDSNNIILDNSNIVESYPNITLPLTQSFIREAYYRVFRSLLLRLTGDEDAANSVDDTLRNMVDVANGRVYYRISNWYDVILFLPFKNRIIPVWQEMMGVRNKTVSTSQKDKIGVKTRVKVAISFFNLILTNPHKMEKLDKYFSDILKEFWALDVKNADNKALIGYYQAIMKKVSDKWDITLVNDMYTFIFTALLKSRLKRKKVAEHEKATNLYISKVSDIESLKPINELIAIAQLAKKENRIPELSQIKSNDDYHQYISKKDDAFVRRIKGYIAVFGDRNVEELKLESKTFRTDPILLIKRIIQYAQEDISVKNNQPEMKELKGLNGIFAKKAAIGIRNREKSRLNRSRLYGMMRMLMLKAGENLFNEGIIEEQNDVFWLFYDEIEKTVKGETSGIEKVIAERRQKYKMFAQLPAYSRLIFADRIFDKNSCGLREADSARNKKHFTGTACSQGVVEGEIFIVSCPTEQTDTRGKIILTQMTDPGWVFLLAGAKGIIAEKGSLLSHTAIIARELGKPAVVGIKNITRYLKNGDKVRLNGDSGEITILNEV